MKNSILERITAMFAASAEDLSDMAHVHDDAKNIVSLARGLIENAKHGEYQDPVKQIARNVKASFEDSEEGYPTFCRQLMLATMRIYYDELLPESYSDSLVAIIERESERILDTLEARSLSYTLGEDVYIKDLMCFTGRLVPCGMYVVDVYSGFPRSYLLKPSILSLPSNVWFFVKTGGVRR